MGNRNNLAGVAAHLCGFLCGEALTFVLTLALVIAWHGSAAFIWVTYSLNSFIGLLGGLVIMSMARVCSAVYNRKQFLKTFQFACVTTLIMPILLVIVLIFFLVGGWERLTGRAQREDPRLFR